MFQLGISRFLGLLARKRNVAAMVLLMRAIKVAEGARGRRWGLHC